MKTTPECLTCFLNQARLTAQQITENPAEVLAAMQAAAGCFPALLPNQTPVENSRPFVNAVTAYFGNDDPFRQTKKHYNDLALRFLPMLRAFIEAAPDPLAAAVRVAAVGNIMDLSLFDKVDMAVALEQVQTTTLAIDHYPRFRQDVAAARRVLVLGDNAGEIAFDLPLVEQLAGKAVYYAVKSGPVANDVTRADARQVGMDRAATVVDIGCALQGAPLNRCSPEFVELFHSADVIIAKGQGNFETLDEVDANLYFIVKAKCAPVAQTLGVAIGDVVLLAQQGRS